MPEIDCPTCGHQFSLMEGVSVVECPACGDPLMIDGERVERVERDSAPSMWYYVDSSRRQAGPVTEQRAITLVRQGIIGRDTLVWRQDMPDWQRLGDSRLAASAGIYPSPGVAGTYQGRTLPQGMAISGMVTGIVGLVFSVIPCFWLFGLPLDVVAMILSGVALQGAKAGKSGGRNMALAGLICSIVGVGILVVWLLVFGLAFQSAPQPFTGPF